MQHLPSSIPMLWSSRGGVTRRTVVADAERSTISNRNQTLWNIQKITWMRNTRVQQQKTQIKQSAKIYKLVILTCLGNEQDIEMSFLPPFGLRTWIYFSKKKSDACKLEFSRIFESVFQNIFIVSEYLKFINMSKKLVRRTFFVQRCIYSGNQDV